MGTVLMTHMAYMQEMTQMTQDESSDKPQAKPTRSLRRFLRPRGPIQG